ncbi:MAG: putative porin [Acidobacteria bacterium]|nr:putative porin [Acidobacteriota bacterium]
MILQKTARLALICVASLSAALTVSAQTPVTRPASTVAASIKPTAEAKSPEAEEVQRQLREQQAELERMRAMLTEQSRVIDELRQRVEQTEQAVSAGPTGPTGLVKTERIAATDSVNPAQAGAGTADKTAQTDTDARLSKVEKQTEAISKQLGSLNFSGDIRLRYESFYGLLNASANGDDPTTLGNPLSSRQRFRVRGRLAIRGQIGKEFDWGLRLATGSFADNISSNQTFTDFFNRKPFALDQIYIAWTPERAPGLRLQAGKFDVPWVRTELTIDNDLTVEGFNEVYSRGFKHSMFKNLTLVAWQLPLLERNSAFVRNANGTVNLDESRRGGRDLALYGAQVRGRFEFSPTTALTLSAADLYWSGTQFISPVQVFGSNLLLPVTITIPANGTTPAQTITTQVSIPRDLLVAGNGNLGLTTASNNATNRDGRLSSGYNLVDLIGRLELNGSKRYPLLFLFNYTVNTQARDVVLAGPGGANLFLKNNENMAYWAEFQIGRQKERGDVQFDYVFSRVEKDAVLTPFNVSDATLQSDMRFHRLSFNYTADPRVLLSFTGWYTQRPNGLLGPFAVTPPGSLNRGTTRLQFDTTFKF